MEELFSLHCLENRALVVNMDQTTLDQARYNSFIRIWFDVKKDFGL